MVTFGIIDIVRKLLASKIYILPKQQRSILLILSSIFSICFCTAQTVIQDSTLSNHKNIFVLQPQVHFGKLVKIYPVFPISKYVNLNELNVALQTCGKKQWHQLYGYPQIGLSFIYGNWGNDQVLGKSMALVPNLAFEINKDSPWTFQARFGFGFAYFTKHYNAIDNPNNNVIGSSVTNLTFLQADIFRRISKSLKINVGISIFHSSDAHYQLPNLGANVPCFNLGIRYYPKIITEFYRHDSIAKPNKKFLLNFFAGYGRHEFGSAVKPTGGPKYPVFQGELYLSKRYKKICNLQVGLSYTYFTDYYDFIINQEFFDSHEHLKASVVTIFLGNEFIIGKFGLIAQGGINLYAPFLKKYHALKHDNDFTALYNPNKIGIQYYFWDPTLKPRHNIYVGLYMKANFGTADYAQVGLGTTF
jgi:hypothetical protein